MSESCTVIIPVGPGHQSIAQKAVESVFGASKTNGRFFPIHAIIGDDTQGLRGRSATRNRCVSGPWEPGQVVMSTGNSEEEAYTSDWLFFLDADDMMCSPYTWGESAFEVASHFIKEYDAIWGTIYEIDLKGNISKRKQTGRLTRYKAFIKAPIYTSVQMGHFVRRSVFDAVGGFNEEMDICEDVDYYLRVWNQAKCIKQEKPLFLNRRGAHTWLNQPEGRPTGRDWSIKAEEMMREVRKRLEND